MGVIVIEKEKLNLDGAVNIFVYKSHPKNYFDTLIHLFNYDDYCIYVGSWCLRFVENNSINVKKYIMEYIDKEKNNDPNLF